MAVRTIKKYTLDDILERKEEVLHDIRTQHRVLGDSTKSFFSPILPGHGQHGIMRKVSTGMAIFDGVMVGVRLIRSIRKAFRRKW